MNRTLCILVALMAFVSMSVLSGCCWDDDHRCGYEKPRHDCGIQQIFGQVTVQREGHQPIVLNRAPREPGAMWIKNGIPGTVITSITAGGVQYDADLRYGNQVAIDRACLVEYGRIDFVVDVWDENGSWLNFARTTRYLNDDGRWGWGASSYYHPPPPPEIWIVTSKDLLPVQSAPYPRSRNPANPPPDPSCNP